MSATVQHRRLEDDHGLEADGEILGNLLAQQRHVVSEYSLRQLRRMRRNTDSVCDPSVEFAGGLEQGGDQSSRLLGGYIGQLCQRLLILT